MCWVQPTEYTQVVVRSRPLLAVTASHTAKKSSPRYPADLFDHFGGVAGEVALEHLEHTTRMLQGLVTTQVAAMETGAAAAELVSRPG